MKKLLVFCLSFILLGVMNVYAETTYNIKYNGNGNTSGEMAIQEGLLYSKRYTLSSNKFAKTGYSFSGWNKKADGSGKSYANKGVVSKLTTKDGGTVNLYAQWTLKEYTIKYELNGGVNNTSNPTTYTVETPTTILKEATRGGYRFLGWYKDSGLTSKVTRIINGSTGNRTYYAKWEAIEYNISYNGNGATKGEMANQTGLKYNKSYTLSSNKYGRTGYSFDGWNRKADGSGKSYANKEVVSKLTTKDNGTVTLYAKWKPKTYTITYELNGGVNDESNPTSYTPETPTIVLKSATKEGYVLAGWYKDSALTSKVTRIFKGTAGNRTLYAKWEPLKYTIEYNGNNNTGGNTPSQTDLLYDQEYQLSGNKYTRTGYKFNGWNTKANGKGTKYSSKSTISNLTNENNGVVTLYAMWKPINYNITYELDTILYDDSTEGYNHSSNPTTYNINSEIELKNPVRKKYEFDGWYTTTNDGINLENKITKVSRGTTGNITLYAKWKIKKLVENEDFVIDNTTPGRIEIRFNYCNNHDSYYAPDYYYLSRRPSIKRVSSVSGDEPNIELIDGRCAYVDTNVVPGRKYSYILTINGDNFSSSEPTTIEVVATSTDLARDELAIAKAKIYLNIYADNRYETVERLGYLGFSNEEAWEAVNNSNFNINNQAIKRLKTDLLHSDIYYAKSNELAYLERTFDKDVAENIINSYDYDWNEHAVIRAKQLIKNSYYSRETLINKLMGYGFTQDEAEYGANNCGATWY